MKIILQYGLYLYGQITFFSLFTIGLQLQKEQNNYQLDDLAP